MKPSKSHLDAIIGITPFEHADARLVVALTRASALGVLDLGRDRVRGSAELAHAAREATAEFGVRVPEGVAWAAADLPARVAVVVVPAGTAFESFRPRTILVQVTSLDEARAAEALGADGLIVKGAESGGRVGEETAFVLFQRVVAATALPVWVQGGVGLHTAAACIAGGAKGIVLDAQLALVRESGLPDDVKAAVRAMDGSETAILAGHRLFVRPDLPVARLKAQAEGQGAASVDANLVLERLGATDLETCFVPAGQDAAFARGLADRFRTAAGLVHGLRGSIEEHLRDAAVHRPLAPGAPLATEHRVRYPILQGPMTRVSDRAAFAAAVARGGGLPFLALALMRGPEVRELLAETREMLGEHAWGVGILGFVPDDLREEQLAVLREMPPPAAIIAGGRPSQARPLEAQGTLTYLHVPSPGLLGMFLRDGARRFIFEGRECGGHVGPRTSFVLWEMQIERLLAEAAPEELRIVFAGGIHDARSAAMVAAMAAPLAARGAHIGVLMGTAYLFTEEVVASGALQAAFQEVAVECDSTVLLETAPGHATRCVDTEYTQDFIADKTRLVAEGKPQQTIWAELEQKNLGRLRLASKGLKREGSTLLPVDASTQRREGMFMIGQVAALRRAVSSIAALHSEVSEDSTARLAVVASHREPVREVRAAPADVAIVGIACIFAGAPDRHAFWANITSGVDSVTEVPKERWDTAIYFDPTSTNGDKTPSKWGGFIPRIAFDPLAYGIPPRSLAAIEPVQLLGLEVARRALEDAGYAERPFNRERTSVIFGAEAGTELSSAYGFRALYPQYGGELPAPLDEHLPRLTEDSFPGVLANVIAGRIANRLDLGGVNYTVDAACAASLAAVDLAVKELTARTSDMVLCGGADLHNGINDYLLFSSVHALSPTGACRAFDASADGIVLGEGIACVVLKRLADAERDGDRIYAVIKGIAGSSDGRSLGLTAPRKEGQMRALERAYRAASVSPAEIGLVEAHGTGTVVGDRTELATLTEVYAGAGALPGAVALGSVKSQIGHTKCAAGMAGLIKVALALHHRVLPPTLHMRKPNPGYDAASSPFTFGDVARPWTSEARKAAVSAFGFGGTNFHVVLSAYDEAAPAAGADLRPAELFLFRGTDRAAALALVDRVAQLLEADAGPGGVPPRFTLADLARSVSDRGRLSDAVQVAIVASSVTDLRDKLRAARAGTADPRGVFLASEPAPAGKVAFLFSGQGSQRPGMLAELFIAFPRMQRFLALEPSLVRRIFPPFAGTPAERAAQVAAVTDTCVAQPALGMVELALADLLGTLGLRADMMAGHSYGELAALGAAGALAPADLIALSAARADCILAAAGNDPGRMAAVSSDAATVTRLLEGVEGVVIANLNAPDQTVVSGTTSGIAQALTRFEEARVAARSIPVACAFHSPVVARAEALFAERLAAVSFVAPRVPVFSNTLAAAYPDEAERIRHMLAAHLAAPVRFVDEIEAMYAAGARVFVEVGPGRVLTALVDRILGDRAHVSVSCDRTGEVGVTRLLQSLAELAVSGVGIDCAPLFAGRAARILDLDKPLAIAPSASVWLVDGHLARPLVGDIPAGALRPTLAPLISAKTGASDRDAAVLEYLRTTREIVEAQRQVMLQHLGVDPTVAETPRALPPARVLTSPGASVPPPSGSSPSRRPPPSMRPSVPPPRPSQRPGAAPGSMPPPSLPPRAARLPAETSAWVSALAASTSPTPAINVHERLLAITSQQTGYPIDMLDLDLDLEAELSIDSIKRIEILGALGLELGWAAHEGDVRDRIVEQLATKKTLRAIVQWLDDPAALERSKKSSPTASNGARHPTAERAPSAVRRYTLASVDAVIAVDPSVSLAGKTWAIVPDDLGVVTALSAALERRGARVRVLATDELGGDVDGLVFLASLAPTSTIEGHAPSGPKRLFDFARRALAAGATAIVAVTHLGAPAGDERDGPRSGVAGLLRSLAKERPELLVRAVALDPREDPKRLAEHLACELQATNAHVEVAYVGGARRALVPRPAERLQNGDAKTDRPLLDADSVVLMTGGARGITAVAAIAIAKKYRCRIELVGRTAHDAAVEAADLASATDLTSLRRAMLARPRNGSAALVPAAVDLECRRVLAARAIRTTLAAIADAGGRATYTNLDVRDDHAFGDFIDALYARHGRIDGVVHGAGVLEDKLFADKPLESFERVFDTKVKSALTLARRLRPDVGFVAFFSSIASAFGNRGQTDYAAANDALDKLAWWLRSRVRGRVVSINWGPWGGAGMVTAELEREFERRGVGLLDPEAGALALLDELSDVGSEAQVIVMNGDLQAEGFGRAEVAPPRDAGLSMAFDA